MLSSLALLCTLALAGSPAVESICWQVGPVPKNGTWVRSPDKTQAVLLIHGFHYHLFDKHVPKAEFRPWQKSDSVLVRTLAKHSDVYAFAYGQNVPIDVVVANSRLAGNVAELRKLGYTDIVLVGHSAGGLIARHFVEDNPDAGVTKVIQVCAPNEGSPLAKVFSPKSQKVFLECLTIGHRKKCLTDRCEKKIPANVQFICVVARSDGDAPSDGVVPCASQWTEDLRKQGIGAVLVSGTHREVVREEPLANTLARLVREKHTRWEPEQIERTRRLILGK
jgi:hypothetical protein